MASPWPPSHATRLSANDLVAALIGPAFVGLAVWFLLNPDVAGIPRVVPTRVDRQEISTRPMRQPLDDPPAIEAGGFRLRCNECHRFFLPPPQPSRRLMQHRDVVLDHGLNDRCLSCHDHFDRERLVIRSGSLPFSEAPRLCAECHGTTYRDWERGTHGKTMGSWDAALGARHRLSCIECHDPHVPAFAPMSALPGPQTLRMGALHRPHRPHGHDPLRPWAPVGPP
jgi:hypothetical protein